MCIGGYEHEDIVRLTAERDEARADLDGLRDELKRVRRERDEARAEVAIARERLGPAGWKLLQELKEARAELESARRVITAVWACFCGAGADDGLQVRSAVVLHIKAWPAKEGT